MADGDIADSGVDGSIDAACVAELCDGMDNDCDGDTDEDFAGLGDPCDVGEGACHASGLVVCSPAGDSVICGATAGTPADTDSCGNGIDDDCDADTDEGCPSPPVLFSPAVGAFTGSHLVTASLRPAFRWLPVTGAGVVTYEIEVDDSCPATGFSACAFASPEFSASGLSATTAQPVASLPVDATVPVGRRFFWRVRACNDAGCGIWSAIHYVNVGRLPNDFNGDGRSDRIISAAYQDSGAVNEGSAYLYFGQASWTTPSTIGSANVSLDNPANQAGAYFGTSVSSVGDVNADGFADFVVGAPFHDGTIGEEGRVYLYLGRATWPASIGAADAAFEPTFQFVGGRFGAWVSGGGDTNNDGFSDLAVGASLWDWTFADEGGVFIYLGRSIWPVTVTTPDINITNPLAQPGQFGGRLALTGDVTADGLADLVATASLNDNPEVNEGTLHIIVGRTDWGSVPVMVTTAEVTIDNPADQAGSSLGSSLAVGDVNGDGLGDILVGAAAHDNPETDEGIVVLYVGRSSWPAAGAPADATIDNPSDQTSASFGSSLCAGSDVDGDGFGDIMVGADGFDGPESSEGAAFIIRGRQVWPPTPVVFRTFDNPVDDAFGNFGDSVACDGDMNADGLGDIVIGAPLNSNGQTDEGTAYLWLGRTTWPADLATAEVTIDNPADQNDGGFGGVN